jgi:hypothetical protein
MSTPTPGPWEIDPAQHCGECGESVTDCRLHAAAPALLDALVFLLADYVAIGGQTLTASDVPADKAIAAIVKANPALGGAIAKAERRA